MKKRKYANFASTPVRFINHVLDLLIFNVMVLIILYSLGILVGLLGSEAWIDSMIETLDGVGGSILGLVSYLLYFSVFETLFGKSPAKFITKTKVVDHRGEIPGWLDICGRSLCRIIPFDQLSFLFGQNWHDRFSNTSVVYDD